MCELQIYDFLHPQQEDIERKSSHPSDDAEIMYATMHDWLINIPPAKGAALFLINIKTDHTVFLPPRITGILNVHPPTSYTLIKKDCHPEVSPPSLRAVSEQQSLIRI